LLAGQWVNGGIVCLFVKLCNLVSDLVIKCVFFALIDHMTDLYSKFNLFFSSFPQTDPHPEERTREAGQDGHRAQG
jgi:hypothetical protein